MAHSKIDFGPTLYGARGEFGLSDRAWRLLLALAAANGWQPEGTLPPDPEHFDHDLDGVIADWYEDLRYLPGSRQRMTERDARAMADALERALPNIPDHDTLSEKLLTRADGSLALWGRPSRADVTITANEEFSGPNKPHLMSLIAYLREGGEIWIC